MTSVLSERVLAQVVSQASNQDLLIPSEEDIATYLVETTRHVCNYHFLLEQTELKTRDPEYPHDLVGENNKFEPHILFGLALRYDRSSIGIFEKYVKPKIDLHRSQYHHRMWEEPNPHASEDEVRAGATDTIIALLEPRFYQGAH